MRVYFGVLGPLRVEVESEVDVEGGSGRAAVGAPERLPRSPVLKGLLGVLLLAEGQRLSAGRLLDLVWGDQATQVGLGALQTGVSRLRSWLGTFEDPDLVLDFDGSGYSLRLHPEAADLGRFRQAVARGDLGAAVALRRGPVFADAVRVSHTDPLLRTVEEDVRAAVLAFAQAALADGSPEAALPHLDALARDTPLDEPVQAARMRLLAADGRPAEALRLFQALRQQVVDELGVEPGAQVREAYSEVLALDSDVQSAAPRPLPVPAQLPPDAAAFVGRERGTVRIREALAAGRLPVIAGMGGIGKTALAVRLANQARGDFPDGQLYVDLRGAGTDPADPGLVLSGFLRALGVEPGQIPETSVDRSALYRSVLSGRRILVVLDNAADEQQVRPLLPGAAGGSGAAALVTSRAALTALDNSELVDLSVLSPSSALALLERLVGAERVAAEPEAAAEILRACDHIPLAVRVVGARLAGRPRWSLARMAGLVRDERDRLDQLQVGDLAIRASFGLSYDRLPTAARRLFRLLGLLDVPDFASWAAAAVADLGLEEAERHLETLVDAHLLEVVGVEPRLRYRFHDLVRLYAREQSDAEDGAAYQLAAVVRAVGGWLWFAERAADRIPGPCYAPIHGPAPRRPFPGVSGALLADSLAWFDTERPALLAITRQACALDLVSAAWDLAACQEKHNDVRGFYDEWQTVNLAVRELCRTAGDRLGAAVLTRGLIEVTTWTGPDDGSQTMVVLHERAMRLFEEFEALGADRGAADALVMAAWSLVAQGRLPEALAAAGEAMALADKSDHPGGRARAHQIIAIARSEDDDLGLAIDHLSQALEIARTLGNTRFEAAAAQFLGAAYCRVGDGERGEDLLTRALVMARAFDDRYTETFSLLYLAKYYAAIGDVRARAAVETAEAISRRNKMSHHLADALLVLGRLDLAAGDPVAAVAHLEESVELWRRRGWGSFLAEAQETLDSAQAAAAATAG
ncbi:AfsR/SARP family transcriptional regulator [Catenulispora rubra]|uniref:AfsR/SARP family transcriptional regulator n=1 Tax=Catenulispora rubra TaxID=280293 RepID=UPI00189280FE|nr:BTAD domain-containing putative transcriptional regulator [Catenulispora rubra]